MANKRNPKKGDSGRDSGGFMAACRGLLLTARHFKH